MVMAHHHLENVLNLKNLEQLRYLQQLMNDQVLSQYEFCWTKEHHTGCLMKVTIEQSIIVSYYQVMMHKDLYCLPMLYNVH